MSRPLRMGAAAAVVSASILLSRLLGMGREVLLASLIGVTAEGDLYRQAFTIPDFLNYLLAGAFLSITLIPILSRHLERGQPEEASLAFTSVFRFITWSIIGLTALMWVAADPLVSLIFPKTTDHDRLVHLTRLVLPAQIFLVAGALLMAVQYTHRRFLTPALAPIVYNLGIIAGGLIGAAMGRPSPESFLWGAVIGAAVGNFGLQWLGARATGTWLIRGGGSASAVREYLVLALPLMLGQSVAVLDEQFPRWFGQIDLGATSALYFARTLNMVPVGLIAQAAGVAAFPFLARLAAGGREDELVGATRRAAGTTVFVAMAATGVFVALAGPMVRILYRYGRFTEADSKLVTTLLVIYAFSIPAWGLHQILARHFYAKRRMWTVVLIGTAGTVVAVPVWLGLYAANGVEGFALASTLVISVYALALLAAWGLDSGWEPVRRLLPTILRGSLAAGAGALAAAPLVRALTGDGTGGPLTELAAALAGGVTALAAFSLTALVLREPEMGNLLRRGKTRGSK